MIETKNKEEKNSSNVRRIPIEEKNALFLINNTRKCLCGKKKKEESENNSKE